MIVVMHFTNMPYVEDLAKICIYFNKKHCKAMGKCYLTYKNTDQQTTNKEMRMRLLFFFWPSSPYVDAISLHYIHYQNKPNHSKGDPNAICKSL